MEFCEGLRAELMVPNLHSRLSPAKTQMEVKTDAVYHALAATHGFLEGEQTNPRMALALALRGDVSTFVSREERTRPEFSRRCPNMHHLIASVEATVQSACPEWNLDLMLTSVQVAQYPGDGISGYVRHCDRGPSCRHESETSLSAPHEDPSKNSQTPQRLVTAIYYVTEHDWNVDLDGGCLRLFHGTNQDKVQDVCPYADRLVVFRSDVVEHEVLASLRRDRLAITVWLYGSTATIISPQSLESLPDSNIVIKEASTQLSPGVKANAKARSIEKVGLPPLVIHGKESPLSSIFVSIPSYRDSETYPTIASLIENATHPERIHVGLVLQEDTMDGQQQQHDWSNAPELSHHQSWCKTNLRCLKLDYRLATGPCLARHLAQALVKCSDEYVLQIDSHMRMRPNWDCYLIHQLGKCPRPQKSILTTYPVGYTLPSGLPSGMETRGTLLVPWKFDTTNGMLRQNGRLLAHDEDTVASTHNDNIPCLLFAGGFNFGMKQMILDCPYDAQLPQLFFGEELSMAVRLYTHGYDLFAPPTSVCYHLWSRDHRPTFQEDTSTTKADKDRDRAHSLAVVKDQLMGSPNARGLGMERSAKDFASALGVNFEDCTIFPGAQDGGFHPTAFASGTIGTNNPLTGNHDKAIDIDDSKKVQQLVAAFLGNM
eukprot:scaffold211689_cov55-Attheya_sp.AAC.1